MWQERLIVKHADPDAPGRSELVIGLKEHISIRMLWKCDRSSSRLQLSFKNEKNHA